MFNPNTIFTIAYGYNSNQLGFFGPNPGVTPQLLSAGFTGVPATFAGHEYVVAFNPSGISTPGYFTFSNGPDHNHSVLPNLLMIRGKQTINIGGEIKYEHLFHDGQNSSFNFDTTATNDGAVGATDGQSFASYLLGLPVSSDRLNGKASLIVHRYFYHFYGQDDIKVSKRLTLNLGLRYEDSQWYKGDSGTGLSGYNVQNGTYAWASTNPITGQAANVASTWATPQPNLLAPRFGFAYLITPKTTIRGGYGFFYNSNFAWEWTEMRGNYPFAISQHFTSLNGAGTVLTPVENVYSASFDPGGVQPPPVGSSMATNFKHGYSQEWNLMVEREIAKNFVVDIGYLGNKGTHLTGLLGTNFAPPGPGAVNPRRPLQNLCAFAGTPQYTCQSFDEGVSDGNSAYNALTVRADKRFTKNVSFLFTTHTPIVLTRTRRSPPHLPRRTQQIRRATAGIVIETNRAV